jgi:mRNA interferase MazF
MVKRRPALVISNHKFNIQHNQLLLAMITTAKQSVWPSDVPILDWREAGLSATCFVRFKLFTLVHDLIVKKTGILSQRDKETVRLAIDDVIA